MITEHYLKGEICADRHVFRLYTTDYEFKDSVKIWCKNYLNGDWETLDLLYLEDNGHLFIEFLLELDSDAMIFKLCWS
jgi:hypothetical protein